MNRPPHKCREEYYGAEIVSLDTLDQMSRGPAARVFSLTSPRGPSWKRPNGAEPSCRVLLGSLRRNKAQPQFVLLPLGPRRSVPVPVLCTALLRTVERVRSLAEANLTLLRPIG